MKLIECWSDAWKLWSVRLSALGTLLSTVALAVPDFIYAAWQSLPDEITDRLPANYTMIVPLVLFVATMVARVIAQKNARG
jgi:hypothetical protein